MFLDKLTVLLVSSIQDSQFLVKKYNVKGPLGVVLGISVFPSQVIGNIRSEYKTKKFVKENERPFPSYQDNQEDKP